MIVYKLISGFVSDLRYEKEDYALKVEEIKFASGFGVLPSLETLHDPAAVAAKEDAEEAEQLRLANIREDVLAQELIEQFKTATAMQISNFVDNNVTDLVSAKTVLKKIILVLALIANQIA